jgi:hypothetical protein
MTRKKFEIKDPVLRSSASGTTFGYAVEARFMYSKPTIINGIAYDKEWREILFDSGAVGVPPRRYSHRTQEHGLFDFAQAEALRWWFLAEAEAGSVTGSLCLETRLVSYKVDYTYKVTAVAIIDAQDARGDTPEDMLPASEPEDATLTAMDAS